MTIYRLEYDSPLCHEEFNINDFDITGTELMRLLAIYRGRSGKRDKYEDAGYLEEN